MEKTIAVTVVSSRFLLEREIHARALAQQVLQYLSKIGLSKEAALQELDPDNQQLLVSRKTDQEFVEVSNGDFFIYLEVLELLGLVQPMTKNYKTEPNLPKYSIYRDY